MANKDVKLIPAKRTKDGKQEYIIEGLDNYRILVGKDGVTVRVRQQPGVHAGALLNGVNIEFEHVPLQLATAPQPGNCHGVKVYECTNLPAVGKYGLYHFSKFLYEASKYMDVCFVSSPDDADVIHLHQVGKIDIPDEWADKNIIIHFHGFKPENFEEYKDWFSEMIFISNYQRVHIFSYGGGHVVWNGVVPYEKIGAVRHYHFIFAQAGYDAKNPEWVIENARKHRTYRIAVAGGIEAPGADNFGYLTQDELQYLQSKSHIFVMPSKKEAFGLAPLYAMLQGTVPALSIYSGVIESVPGNLLIAFDPEDTTLDDIWHEYMHRKLWEKTKAIREAALWMSPERWASAITPVLTANF